MGRQKRRLRVARDGRVLTVAIDDPPRNYISPQLIDELECLLDELERDEDIRCVILTGAAPGLFVTHYDVPQFVVQADKFGRPVSERFAAAVLRLTAPLQRVAAVRRLVMRTPLAGVMLMHQIRETYERIPRSDKVFIAAINGLAMGAGLELALACDLRLMAAGDDFLGMPESALGGGTGVGGGQRLIRMVGATRAADLLLEGRVIRADEALELGIVNRIVPADRLAAEAADTAARLATRPTAAVVIAKEGIAAALSQPLQKAIVREQSRFLFATSQPEAMQNLRTYSAQLEALGQRRYDPYEMLGEYWNVRIGAPRDD